jgi:hypothetical protein
MRPKESRFNLSVNRADESENTNKSTLVKAALVKVGSRDSY